MARFEGGNRFRWRGVSAPGYENINDREQPRNDPVFGILAGRDEPDEPLAGRDTEFLLEANVHPVELTDSDSRRSQCGVFRSSQQRQEPLSAPSGIPRVVRVTRCTHLPYTNNLGESLSIAAAGSPRYRSAFLPPLCGSGIFALFSLEDSFSLYG